jgi:hypothetical protein
MANRKATFAKRQRETDLKDRAKQKEDRRNQKRSEVRDVKGPAIAWDEAVRAVESSADELPSLGAANQGRDDNDEAAIEPPAGNVEPPAAQNAAPAAPAGPGAAGSPAMSSGPIKSVAPAARPGAGPVTAPAPAAPRRVG